MRYEISNLERYPQFIELLASWHQNQWFDSSPDISLDDRIERLNQYLQPDFMPSMFIAHNEKLLGSAALISRALDKNSDNKIRKAPWLTNVYVEKAYRGQGIGISLVEYIIEQARVQQVESIFLSTHEHTSFYQKFGWKTFKKTTHQNKTLVIMRNQIR